MSERTAAELLFEQLCRHRGLTPRRIAEDGRKSADYEVDLATTTLIVEVKEKQRRSSAELGADERENLDGIVAPSGWVRKQIGDSYEQLKSSARGTLPTLLVLYNNAGLVHWLDSFCISKGMFGSMGLRLGLFDDEVRVTSQGFFGGRKVTASSCRSLSAIAVLRDAVSGSEKLALDAYHNPFASVPISPKVLARLASAQYMHPDPHSGPIVGWVPTRLEEVDSPYEPTRVRLRD